MKRVLKLLQIGVSLFQLAIITFMLAAIGANSYTFANEGKTVIQAAGGTASIVPLLIKTGFRMGIKCIICNCTWRHSQHLIV